MDVLCSELEDVEVVISTSSMCSSNDSVVTKMSLQRLRCDAFGVDVRGIVVRCHSLDVDEACGLYVLRKEVAQSDVLRALVESKLIAETQCRCTISEDVDR